MCRRSVQLSPWQPVIRSPRGLTETRPPDSVLFVSTFNRLSLACLPPEPFPLWTFQPPRLLLRRCVSTEAEEYYSWLIRVEVVIFLFVFINDGLKSTCAITVLHLTL